MATAGQVLECSFERWYHRFESVTFRSQVLPLPQDFVDYLVQDGVYLPEQNLALPKRSAPDPHAADEEYREWSDDDNSDSLAEPDIPVAASWPSVKAKVEQAIAELGGRVIPKLNWSCPKDATWVAASNSTVCTNADEVLLLLKSSDRIAHDICHAFDSCSDGPFESVQWVLVLKKQYDLKADREFRCFIKSHDLVGVCQRDVTQHFPALIDQQDDLEENILEFFEEQIQHKFPSSDYTMDVYVATSGTVRLMDFNPVGGSTAPLLFDWDELGYGQCCSSHAQEAKQGNHQLQNGHSATDGAILSINSESHNIQTDLPQPLDFRILTEPVALRPNKGAYGMPYDLVDTSQGSAVLEMLQQVRDADTALAAMRVMDANSKAEE